MAQCSPLTKSSMIDESCAKFVRLCATEFEWKDLSKDVIMDVGCGPDLCCGKALLEQFPNVQSLIAIDKSRHVITEDKSTDERIQFRNADILDWDSLKCDEGKMDKVLSTNTIHEIFHKELAFQNVYRLLKPGGEAAFYFCLNSDMHKFLAAFLEIPNIKAMLKGSFMKDMYPEGRGKEFYKEMLEQIGFQDVRAVEHVEIFPFLSDRPFKDTLFEVIKDDFIIPPDCVQTFKDEAMDIYEKTIDKYDGQRSFVFVDINLLGVKPLKSSDSKVEDTDCQS